MLFCNEKSISKSVNRPINHSIHRLSDRVGTIRHSLDFSRVRSPLSFTVDGDLIFVWLRKDTLSSRNKLFSWCVLFCSLDFPEFIATFFLNRVLLPTISRRNRPTTGVFWAFIRRFCPLGVSSARRGGLVFALGLARSAVFRVGRRCVPLSMTSFCSRWIGHGPFWRVWLAWFLWSYGTGRAVSRFSARWRSVSLAYRILFRLEKTSQYIYHIYHRDDYNNSLKTHCWSFLIL